MKSKVVAFLLALFLGVYGIHQFYLENDDKGFRYLFVTIFGFGIGSLIVRIESFIDAIKIISMSNDDFNSLYNNSDKILQQNETSSTIIPEIQLNNEMDKTSINIDLKEKYEKLKQYSELYNMGIFTEEEFIQLKKEILK